MMTIAQLLEVLERFSPQQQIRVQGRLTVTGLDGPVVVVNERGLRLRPANDHSLEPVTD